MTTCEICGDPIESEAERWSLDTLDRKTGYVQSYPVHRACYDELEAELIRAGERPIGYSGEAAEEN